MEDRRLYALALELEAHDLAPATATAPTRSTSGRTCRADWTVTLRFGRAGKVGRGCRALTYAVADREAAWKLGRSRLLRRLTAPRQIGCAYWMTRVTVAPDKDPVAWVPAALLPTGEGA